MVPFLALLELMDGDTAIGAGAREDAAALVGCPAHHVYASCVDGELEDFGPCCGGGLLGPGGEGCGGCLAPDEDFAIVGGGGEEGAEFWVRLGGLLAWEFKCGVEGGVPRRRTILRLRVWVEGLVGRLERRGGFRTLLMCP